MKKATKRNLVIGGSVLALGTLVVLVWFTPRRSRQVGQLPSGNGNGKPQGNGNGNGQAPAPPNGTSTLPPITAPHGTPEWQQEHRARGTWNRLPGETEYHRRYRIGIPYETQREIEDRCRDAPSFYKSLACQATARQLEGTHTGSGASEVWLTMAEWEATQ